MELNNNKQRLAVAFAIGVIITSSFLYSNVIWLSQELENAREPGDCWFILQTNMSQVTSKVHVWNMTDEGGKPSCSLLKDLCYTIQINYNVAKSLDYDCKWNKESAIYGNASCVCRIGGLEQAGGE